MRSFTLAGAGCDRGSSRIGAGGVWFTVNPAGDVLPALLPQPGAHGILGRAGVGSGGRGGGLRGIRVLGHAPILPAFGPLGLRHER